MEEIFEKVMNFVNENTMLLIIICIFLIVVLVIYLIDNTLKTKRMEDEIAKKELDDKVKALEEETQEKVPQESIVVEPKEEVKEEVEIPELEKQEVSYEEENATEPYVSNETTIVETPPIINPSIISMDTNIEELLNKDYSNNNIVENINEDVVMPAPVVEEPKSKYNNEKKLSDIFAKKEVETPKKIETTQDFSDELDRILQKLNNEEKKIESNSLEETNNYTNMF